MSWRKHIPFSWRKRYRLAKRYIQDIRSKDYMRIAKAGDKVIQTKDQVNLEQLIRSSYLFENKIHNMRIASKRIKSVTIKSGDIFSFWDSVKEANQENGYKKGRNIIDGIMTEDYGGGLCQLSGCIFHLSLIAGLKIVERYNHSVDFYTDETRFTPIGTDATIVYAYKDLRVQNPYKFDICFDFEVFDNKIIAHLLAEGPLKRETLNFEIKKKELKTDVSIYNTEGTLLSSSGYRVEKKAKEIIN